MNGVTYLPERQADLVAATWNFDKVVVFSGRRLGEDDFDRRMYQATVGVRDTLCAITIPCFNPEIASRFLGLGAGAVIRALITSLDWESQSHIVGEDSYAGMGLIRQARSLDVPTALFNDHPDSERVADENPDVHLLPAGIDQIAYAVTTWLGEIGVTN